MGVLERLIKSVGAGGTYQGEGPWREYRTKRLIVEVYDAVRESMRAGHSVQIRLDPPPTNPRCCNPPMASRAAGRGVEAEENEGKPG